ncbi:hypothetical protein [Kitasatospora sp. NBC_01266]|uniref:hypothetical protein n=1 Tax=Kitasatospora sp. NBC_01266 TaxID=2903572 RepID=UPI002E34575A|nr:hypothetical protein [Kitasatospora sp. NBC_01266]
MTLTMLLLTAPPLLALLLTLTDPARTGPAGSDPARSDPARTDPARPRAHAARSAAGRLPLRARRPGRGRGRGRHAAPVGRRAQASLGRAG